jgi:hypothetical protein
MKQPSSYKIQNSILPSPFSINMQGKKWQAQLPMRLCALKDALDASDSERFSSSQYGAANALTRNAIRTFITVSVLMVQGLKMYL